ncbi:MAG TPA: VTT domain-containing protein [Chitinophagales bacterium]|nr:VTT domain-containing protein [Chitinophagales bacterium]
MGEQQSSRKEFIWQNILKTVVYLLAVIGIILASKHFFKDELDKLIDIARHNLPVFYTVFFLLEILPGQLPPEVFFVLYSKETTSFPEFISVVFFLACLSYIAINLSYYIGKILPRLKPGNWFEKNRELVNQYGSVIIVFGMFTPLPSAIISMAAGYLNFPAWKFRLLTLARFLRFLGYGPIVYFST